MYETDSMIGKTLFPDTYLMTGKHSCNIIFSTNLSMDAEYHREQTVYYSVRKRKVLQMQPSGEA